MKRKYSKLTYVLLISLFFYACSKNNVDPQAKSKEVIASFRFETGLNAIYTLDTSLLNAVKSWQGHGDYPGVDNWSTARIPNNFNLLGGLPGQSEYYTIDKTIVDTDTLKINYWESLQVKENPTFGYRPMVGVFEMQDTLLVAISKTLANPQFGSGGGWQIYVQDFNQALTVLDTIYLK